VKNSNIPFVLLRPQDKGRTNSMKYQKSQSLKDLEILSFEAKRLKYPNNPYPVGETFEDKTANGLTRSIIAYLRLQGHTAERIANQGRCIDRTQTFTDTTGRSRTIGSVEWVKGTGQNGSSDIHCCINGRAVYIEVKINSDRQSQAQKNYQKQVETAFGTYYIARSFESFLTWYNQLFEKP
jgi:hypothetical protein